MTAYVDGKPTFTSSSYKQGLVLPSEGVLALGQLQARDTAACSTAMATSLTGACRWSGKAVAGKGFSGYMQNIRLYNYALSAAEATEEMHWPYTRSYRGLSLYWRFTPLLVTVVNATQAGSETYALSGKINLRTAIQYANATVSDLGIGGLNHVGTFSANGSALADGTPSASPFFPCGEVHSNVWYFSAGDSIRGDQRRAYNGRLSFSLMSPSHHGLVRNPRAGVVIDGLDTKGRRRRISYLLGGFGSPPDGSCRNLTADPTLAELTKPRVDPLDESDRASLPCAGQQARLPAYLATSDGSWSGYGTTAGWRRYTVILREDFGWMTEPTGTAATTADMMAVLQNVQGVYIRGDWWRYGPQGAGQEVTYINDVRLQYGF